MNNLAENRGHRIAVIGPESTGKSTLSADLAAHFKSIWVPEYARQHLEMHGLEYNFDDLLTIARKQVEEEDKLSIIAGNKPLFIDTNLYVIKVWSEFVFNKCHWWILDEIVNRKYDYYLLCDIDLPWEYQPMREYPDLDSRKLLFHMYKDILINQQVPWQLITGSNEERLESAIQVVQPLLASSPHYSSTD